MCIDEMIAEHGADIDAALAGHTADWTALVRHVQTFVDDDCHGDEFDDDAEPAICLTVATDDGAEEWAYQTGDNSYTGGAYHFPHWAVVYVMRDSAPADIAEEIAEQLGELIMS